MTVNKRRAWAYNKSRDKQEINKRGSRNGTAASVYVISLGDDGTYKIGMSGNMQQRLGQLRAGNPKIREVFSYRVPNALKCERHIHASFRLQKVDREVYYLSREDLEAIRNYLNEYQDKPDPSTVYLFKYVKHRDIQRNAVL